MTVFDPTSSGIVAVHCVVPAAVPDWAVLVDQVTDVTPAPSLAVPLKTMVADEVAIEVDEGLVIVSDGGAELGELCVIVTVCETRLKPSVALTAIEFAPITSGMALMVHEDDPCAVPEP